MRFSGAWTPYDVGSLRYAGWQLRPQSTSLFHRSLLVFSRLHTYRSVYYLYAFIRRPRLILDFSLTLLFNHLVLTTYYSASIPTSVFFWIIMCVSTAGTVVFAEQLCVKREMNEGLVVATAQDAEDSVEMGSLLRED